jgi:2'-5' RNA ligase
VEQLHQQLNSGPLYYDEPFDFHPHITLAQGVVAADAAEVSALAAARWREYRDERSFAIEEITFVQNVAANEWVDLHELTLALPHAGLHR